MNKRYIVPLALLAISVSVRSEKAEQKKTTPAPAAAAQNPDMERVADYPISGVLLGRWSPYAMSGQLMSEEELFGLFEAARWAPSSGNAQPWRFIYARRNSAEWSTFFRTLGEFNQAWAKNAAALVAVVSRNTDQKGRPSKTHALDTGAAWENMALQGYINGLVVHAMEGFDYDKARVALKIPDGYTIHAMVAIGKPGRDSDLPESMRGKTKRSGRKPITEFVHYGSFEGPFKDGQ
jgi:nitroreductase